MDDLLQETYVRLYDWASRHAAEVQSARSLAFSIARNVAREWVRRKQVVPLDLVADLQSVDSADERERLEERIDAQQQLEIIAQAIRCLPPRCRRVFLMRKVYGHSQKEIAAKLGISENTVEQHLFRATRRCADILSGMPSARGLLSSLNADSDIRVRMSAERREVRLLRGEAYFKVAHDSRPFDVDARGTLVRAIGTAFSVRLLEAGRVDVLVSEGLVAVRPRELKLDLDAVAMPELPELVPRVAAGQAAVVDSSAVIVQPLPPERIEGRLAWIDGWLDMTDKTLDEVVAEFNRFNEQQIVIVDPKVGLIRKLGGRFRLSDPESFVAALVGRGEIRADAHPAGLDGPAIIHLYDAGPGAFPGSPTD